jgi:alkanesulfonate monooxygenase SsuD/methylene tetrahydromethanopterin reductase-like flavin-dependent oxidoreductase (luciferase family)
MHRVGFATEADAIRAAYLNRDRERAAQLVTDEMVDAMTIIGTPQQCRDQMQTYFDAGVHEIRLVFNEPNKEAYIKALKAIAPKG